MELPCNAASVTVPPERDACAIICYINKSGCPTHGNVRRTIDALIKMGHRAGEINGEGDGCGILTDIPTLLWRELLAAAGQHPELAENEGFAVGHLLVPKTALATAPDLKARVLAAFGQAGVRILAERPGRVRSEVLAVRAREEEPLFWQIALSCPDPRNSVQLLHSLQARIEAEYPVHVASLSTATAVYKTHGAPELLSRYYPELKRRDFLSRATIGHSRYSTNTLPTVLRAQPFTLLGHNGEINTIFRLREEARMLGIDLPTGGSDSQDLNRTLEGLMAQFGFSLFEAFEMVLPPIFSEMELLPGESRAMYTWFRRFLKASAQGPAAIVARHLDACVFSVDAMGLRPLWIGETEEELFASSELGVLPHEEIVADPRPLAPGEKVGVRFAAGKGAQVLLHDELRREALALLRRRVNLPRQAKELRLPEECKGRQNAPTLAGKGKFPAENLFTAFAWRPGDLLDLREMARSGREPIASLGYDGPLAPLALSRQNLSDYFQEQVAVVTNPAIDREREGEHFSTRVFLGPRPSPNASGRGMELALPLLLGGRAGAEPGSDEAAAREFGTGTLDELCRCFARGRTHLGALSLTMSGDETLAIALERLQREAVAAASRGAAVLLLDDRGVFGPGKDFLDPFLALAAVHNALLAAREGGRSLRRRTSLVLRSGALRNLHDLVFALGTGADALCPHLMWEAATEADGERGMANLFAVLSQGIEKVISTMGTHEIGGYGGCFASIGLGREVARIFALPDFCGPAREGLTLARLEEEGRARRAVARSRERVAEAAPFRFWPHVWRMVNAVAKMEENYNDLSRLIQKLEEENPLAIRHLLDFRFPGDLTVDPEEVDTAIGGHDLPILFSAMSFGSQGETPFRIYAEAARRLNIICMNGEGGEIADMLGRFRENRGQQIASGRFGVNMAYLNSADYLEIKVGQGAKPGEGGHLPGAKVTAKIAAARNATPGVALISPSNNHDIYSIEDLAQIIEELRTANPTARISVKVPAVAGIAAIAMGIAKAGADIINISGFEGGTGAARKHAIRHVGLPAEIGVAEAHRALTEAGVRRRVEIWADGGVRSGRDVIKLMLLGADRVGFGTMAMVVIGCTVCRGCHLGTCHVGIATQIESGEEAAQLGLKRFVPRVLENGVIYETTFFRGVAREIRTLTARLGFGRTRDLVGHAELLVQSRGLDRLDLSPLLVPAGPGPGAQHESKVRIIRKPLNFLTSLISGLVSDAFAQGDEQVHYDDDSASSSDRAIGTHLAGAMTRRPAGGWSASESEAILHFRRGSIPGNGLGAFNISPITIRVEGGAQDGVGKSARGGKIVILKGENRSGRRVGGSVGKGLAYGAQGGTFLIQGDADSRACVRLSGADVVLGGHGERPLAGGNGSLAEHANLKGFAFEYMTAGRVVVLGDPGPWICSGMTGGTVYCRLDEAAGLTVAALSRRLARGAAVEIRDLEEGDAAVIEGLLLDYHRELLHSHQEDEARWVEGVIALCGGTFVKIVPARLAVPSVSTE
ncbi:MAG TPA: glutamate synthase-related protein [Desulfuromonadaceae bacterium]